MPGTIAILDDEIERLDAMLAVLSRRLPDFSVVTFRTAPEIIEWLGTNLSSVALLSLDHDLIVELPGAPDMGTGRDVADFLAERPPVCHVIIHTTNSPAGTGMEMVLGDAGWSNSRVHPYGDLDWVTAWWIREVIDHLPEAHV